MSQARPGTMRIGEISSAANPLLKVFRHALKEGTTRDGWLAVEGPHLVEEALASAIAQRNEGRSISGRRAGAVVRSVLVARAAQARLHALLDRLPRETEIALVPERLFAQVTQTETPQGIAALVELPDHDLESLLAASDALFVVACGVQDPGNLGTILRSAQALGATALVTLPATVSPFNPKAVRSSAGAVLHLPTLPSINPDHFFRRLRAADFQIVAADRHGSATITDVDWRRRTALLIGREGSGLDEAALRAADRMVCIPIRAGTDSLNAAAAANIFLYEIARQRGFDCSTAKMEIGK